MDQILNLDLPASASLVLGLKTYATCLIFCLFGVFLFIFVIAFLVLVGLLCFAFGVGT